ncbi:adenosine-specific kinase [Methanomassiliicoccus luminyensis]|uniref:adenosine-specific kinase n=1 Tax=Methanomassiliicoccus luminyensis TaxID=1080712 RepID=UPI0003699EF6|nr:adenosine-specific kinase [Methanomassiliicoccus luminyensis]
MKTEAVALRKPADSNIIVGQSHFIKTAEDLYEALVGSVPGIKFGIAFCEASGDRLVRREGNDGALVECAVDNAVRIGAGHSFVIVIMGAYPINVLRSVKDVPEVCGIFCATANEAEVIVAVTEKGRGIIGVVDGQTPLGVEGEEDIKKRRELLRRFGYKR